MGTYIRFLREKSEKVLNITEMARIMFDALYRELAGVMTVAFIPVALLASIVAIKVLHRR